MRRWSMWNLKTKALVYKYTGWYFADKEENEYIQSDECWEKLFKIVKNKQNELDPQSAQGLLIGLWQSEHGFHRPASFLKYKRPRAFWRVVAWWVDLYTVIKWDIQSCLRKK